MYSKRTGLWSLLIPIAIMEAFMLLVVFYAASREGQQGLDRNRWVLHTYQVTDLIHATSSDAYKAESAQRGYLLTGDQGYLILYQRSVSELSSDLKGLRWLTRDNSVQQQSVHELDLLVTARIALMQATVTNRNHGTVLSSAQAFRSNGGTALMRKISIKLDQMTGEEARLLKVRTLAMQRSQDRATLMSGITFALVMLMLGTTTGLVGYSFAFKKRTETALRENQGLLTEAQQVAHIGHWEIDHDRWKVAWSSQIFNLFSLDPQGAAPSYEDWLGLLLTEDVATFDTAVMRAMAHGTPFEVDIRFCAGGGLCTWIQMTGHVERGDDGTITQLFGTAMDIDRRKTSELTLLDYSIVLEFKIAEAERINAKLEGLATTDGLTGLKNHRAFQEHLRDAAALAARNQTPLSLILLDVDGFKTFNDTFGHPAGDTILKQVSDILLVQARESDIVARYGGEEFAVILPGTNTIGAMNAAERMRAALASAQWTSRSITASFGVSSAVLGEDLDEMIASADRSLYRAKAQGRNQVCG